MGVMGVASIAQLAPLFAVAPPPPDPARKGLLRSELKGTQQEAKRAASVKQALRAEERAAARRREQESKVTWAKKAKRGKEPALWPWPSAKAFTAQKRKKDVAEKVNYIPSSVNKGKYPKHLLGRCSLAQVWSNPNQPSGLDSWEVPLYSSFTADRVFRGPHPPMPAAPEPAAAPVPVADLMESFVVKKRANGSWSKTRELSKADLAAPSSPDPEAGPAGVLRYDSASDASVPQGKAHRVPSAAGRGSSLSMSRSTAGRDDHADNDIGTMDLQPERKPSQQDAKPAAAAAASAQSHTTATATVTAPGTGCGVDEALRHTASSMSSFSSRLLYTQRPDVSGHQVARPRSALPGAKEAGAPARGMHAAMGMHGARPPCRPSSAPSHRAPAEDPRAGAHRRHSSAAQPHGVAAPRDGQWCEGM